MNNSAKGVDKFKEGYNCAQAVLFSLTKHTGISEDDSLKIGTGFGGGMGRTQHVCGAVSGGILALNLLLRQGLRRGERGSGRGLFHGAVPDFPASKKRITPSNAGSSWTAATF